MRLTSVLMKLLTLVHGFDSESVRLLNSNELTLEIEYLGSITVCLHSQLNSNELTLTLGFESWSVRLSIQPMN